LDFCWGSAPDTAREVYSAPPDPSAIFKRLTSKGIREVRGKGRERKGTIGRKEGEGK